MRVALLESARVGRGSTIASTALLMQEPDRDFGDLARRFGRAATREIWMSLARATRVLAKTIRALQMDVGLCTCESVYFTLDPEKVRGLRREFMARKRAGLPGRWLSPQALHRKTGIHAHAAKVTSVNAQVNPARTCQAFLSAAARHGARIFERSHARRVSVSKTGIEGRPVAHCEGARA